MNIDKAFPSKYLKAADIGEDGAIVTIREVQMEDIKGGEKKPVAYFEGKTKGLVLNKTNANMIAKIADSRDSDDWSGTKIRLIATEVEFQGDLVQAIRVRELPKAAKPKPETRVDPSEIPDDDQIPF